MTAFNTDERIDADEFVVNMAVWLWEIESRKKKTKL